MNAKQKNIDIKSLRSEISILKKSLLNLNFQKASGQLEKTSQIRKIKRNIACIGLKFGKK